MRDAFYMGMTITELIDVLQGVYAEHGDVPVLDGKQYDYRMHHVNVVAIDDWDNTTKDGEYEIPGIGYAVSLGSKF